RRPRPVICRGPRYSFVGALHRCALFVSQSSRDQMGPHGIKRPLMPISIEGRQDGAGVIYHCHGDMTIDDFFQAGIGFLAFPEEIKKWRYAIIDLTSVGAMKINSDDIRTVVEQNKRITSLAHPGPLLAVASPKDLGFGLSRIWEVLMEQIGWETMTFRSRAVAEAWTRQRAKQKFYLYISLAI